MFPSMAALRSVTVTHSVVNISLSVGVITQGSWSLQQIP